MKTERTAGFAALFLMSALFPVCMSCRKEQTLEREKVYLNLSVTDVCVSTFPGTKTSGSVERMQAEKKIRNIQVFVFNKDGEIDNCRRYVTGGNDSGTWTMPEPLECTTGTKDIWVVANARTDYTNNASIVNIAKLKEQTVRLEEIDTDGTVSDLVMVGHADDVAFSASNGASFSTEVVVSRLTCAVVLEKVQNLFQNANYRDKVSLTGVFLMQVPGIQRIDGSILASDTGYDYSFWYARHSNAIGTGWLSDSFAEVSVPYGESKAYNTPHTFYSFANDYGFEIDGDPSGAVLNDGTDSKSSSYLVVEAKVNGKKYYYPVVLPKLYANKKYNVSLTVAHLGSSNPWEKVSFTDFCPSISVVDWDNKYYSEEI